jgi:hypothetical protein
LHSDYAVIAQLFRSDRATISQRLRSYFAAIAQLFRSDNEMIVQ